MSVSRSIRDQPRGCPPPVRSPANQLVSRPYLALAPVTPESGSLGTSGDLVHARAAPPLVGERSVSPKASRSVPRWHHPRDASLRKRHRSNDSLAASDRDVRGRSRRSASGVNPPLMRQLLSGHKPRLSSIFVFGVPRAPSGGAGVRDRARIRRSAPRWPGAAHPHGKARRCPQVGP